MIIIIYSVFTALTVAIIFVMGIKSEGFPLDDIIIPFGIFAAFTGLQALTYHFSNGNNLQHIALLVLSIIKTLVTLTAEFLLDIWNIYFGRPDTVAHSILIIAFMAVIVIAGITEIAALVRMQKSKSEHQHPRKI